MNDKTKVFLFFGEDLKNNNVEHLRRYCENGYTLVPLNASAVGVAGRAGVTFVPLDEYMGGDDFVRARDDANRWAGQWFRPEENALASSGICWPRFDREAMQWFWRDIAVAARFAAAFKRKGGAAVELYADPNPRPSLSYDASDSHAVMLKALLREKCRLIVRPDSGGERENPWREPPAIRFVETAPKGAGIGLEAIDGKIVFALNPGEFHRFIPAIANISSQYPGQVIVVSIFPWLEGAAARIAAMGVSVVRPVSSPASNPALAARFLAGFGKSVDAGEGREWGSVLGALKYHFEHYCVRRWPILATSFQSWSNLWERHRPQAVFVSSLPDGESQLPAEAARRAGIKTFSLPHCEFSPREEFIVDIDHVLCNTPLSRTVLKNKGFSGHQIEICKELIHVDEYRSTPVQVEASHGNWNVLVLTYPVTGKHFAANAPVTAQFEALKALANPPEEMLARLAMVIKPHPGKPETELFSAVDSSLAGKVCHPNVELQELMASVDLVIALNCSYSVIIHTLRFEKPVVYFFTNPFYRDGIGAHKHAHLLFPAGTMVSSAEALWRTVSRFFTESAFAHELKSKALAFVRENLDESGLPTIGEVVKGCLAGHGEPFVDRDRSEAPTIPAVPMNRILPEHENLSVELVDGRQDYGELLPEEVVAICKLARQCQPGRIFEFGTFQGGTTLRLAANTEAEIFTFDLPPKGHPDFSDQRMDDPDLDVYPDTPGIRFHNTPYAERIRQIYGDSQTFDFSPYSGTMDFVFVDACHHFEYALRDSMNAFKMIRPGGVIVWHDYAEWAPGVVRALNTVSQRYPLRHISGTSLVVYLAGGSLLNDSPEKGGDRLSTMPTDRPRAGGRADLLERIARAPGDVDVLVNLARMSMADRRPDDALAFLQDALILDPVNQRALALKAEIEKS